MKEPASLFQLILESSQQTLNTTDLKSIAWLSGLLEGEGSFCITKSNSPTITVQMNDKDVVERAATLLGGRVYGPYRHKRGKQLDTPHYRAQVHGAPAIGWMLTIFSFLGSRRRAKIRDIVNSWTIYQCLRCGRSGKSSIPQGATT